MQEYSGHIQFGGFFKPLCEYLQEIFTNSLSKFSYIRIKFYYDMHAFDKKIVF